MLSKPLPYLLILTGLFVGACGGEPPASAPEPDPTPMDTVTAEAPAASPADIDPAQLHLNLAAAAKRLCSSVFVSGRSLAHVRSEELAEAASSGLRFDLADDPARATVSAGSVSATAVFRPHLGCTLLRELAAEALLAQLDASAYPEVAMPDPELPWPLGARVDIPESVAGIDLAAVQRAVDRAFAEPDPANPARTRAVVVVHGGRILAERYADPFDAETPQLGWSMTKTVTAALTGMRVADGAFNVDAPVPIAAWHSNAGDTRAIITLNNLLQMSSGLRFAEIYSTGQASDVVDMLYGRGAHAMGAFAASFPLGRVPGSHWSYASGTTNIIAMLLRDSFDSQAAYFAYPRERLFNPLRMTSAVIEPDESGVFVGSSYMYATPRDWAKLGLLYLQDGVWNGERLLPERWVGYSLRPAAAAPQGQYGAQVWLNRGAADDPADRPYPDLPTDLYHLSGFEGQNVVVVPTADLVVVRMGLTSTGPRVVWPLVRQVLDALEAPAP
jgi:CubicO group peptidase (beta-lactamase class C family)